MADYTFACEFHLGQAAAKMVNETDYIAVYLPRPPGFGQAQKPCLAEGCKESARFFITVRSKQGARAETSSAPSPSFPGAGTRRRY